MRAGNECQAIPDCSGDGSAGTTCSLPPSSYTSERGYEPRKEQTLSDEPTKREKSDAAPVREICDHGLNWLQRAGERVCALEYLNRFVAPQRVERVLRRGSHLFLVFDTGERLECCCEGCGESHGDDQEFTREIKEVALGRRALRFRVEEPEGGLVIWFARGDHLHLHRNALVRFQPARRRRSVRPTHTPPPAETPQDSEG